MLDIDSLVKYIILFIDKNVNRYELKRTQFYRDYLSQQHRFYKLQHLCHQQIEGIVGIGSNLIDKGAKPSLWRQKASTAAPTALQEGSVEACMIHQQTQGQLFSFLSRDLHNPRHSGNTMTEVMRHEKNAINNMAAK